MSPGPLLAWRMDGSEAGQCLSLQPPLCRSPIQSLLSSKAKGGGFAPIQMPGEHRTLERQK